ncbi:MAG: cysteine hydrolase [Sedimentisphaerales bacterium]|nr:cysteine hydrolase [Sedimentisphaerales bacterium]
MIRQIIGSRGKRIIIDIDTQKDLLFADGCQCIRNHRRVLIHIRRIMAWARLKHIPVISISKVYPNNNNGVSNGHCIHGTDGQRKISYTLLSSRAGFAADNNINFPADILRRYRQIILHKRCSDPFDEPRIERLLSEIRANEFILIGAYTEDAVKATALGLLQRGRNVTVLTDAVGSQDKDEAKLALRKMKAKGARLIETKTIAGTSSLKLVGVCDCKMCRQRQIREPVQIRPLPYVVH